ncbi:MAG: hypothetical protein Q9186_005525 [Xanthomendoza sp. 1 TL-2023]
MHFLYFAFLLRTFLSSIPTTMSNTEGSEVWVIVWVFIGATVLANLFMWWHRHFFGKHRGPPSQQTATSTASVRTWVKPELQGGGRVEIEGDCRRMPELEGGLVGRSELGEGLVGRSELGTGYEGEQMA